VSSNLDGTPRERLAENLKTPYAADEEAWSALLDTFAAEIDELEEVRAQVRAAKFVETADPASLERLAGRFDLERRTNEPIEEFRARVKVGIRSQLGSGTIPEIRDVAMVLLNADRQDLEVREPVNESAFIQLAMDTNEVDVPISPAVLSEIISEVSAAGVNVGVNIFIGEGGTMILSGDPVTSSTVNSAGFSSVNLGPLSSGEWTLSRQ